MGTLVDYKFQSLQVDPEEITICYSIYEGDITTEQEDVIGFDTPQDVTRYRRETLLTKTCVSWSKAQVVAELDAANKKKLSRDLAASDLVTLWDRWGDFVKERFNVILSTEATNRGKSPIQQQSI